MEIECPKCDFKGDDKEDFHEKCINTGWGYHKGERAHWGRWEYTCPQCDYYWIDEDCTI